MNSIVNKHTFLAALMLLVMLLPGCSDSRSPMDSDAPVNMTFSAGIEEPDDTLSGTRTLLNGSPSDATRSLLWQSSDAICVSTGSTTAKFTVSSGTGSTTASFSGSISQTGTYYAAYPYSMVSGYSSGSFTINLPSIQKYRSGGIQTDSYPMVAQLSGSRFNFKNLCGILVINLTGSAEVSSISFSGKDQSGNAMKVAGQGTVSMSYSSAPSLQMKQTAQTSVTLDCEDSYGNGVTLGSTATPFHLVLPAGTYSSFTLTVTTTDGETMTVNAVRPLTITRSRRTTTGALPFKADGSQSATHEYVDLGLSVKWATCNIGASKPEKYGDYFAWGETAPKSVYNWSTYRYCNGSKDAMTKYCSESSYGYNGYTDSKTVLNSEDDAAHVNWGGGWRMPTRAEQDELRENCTWTWTTMNGIKGYKVQSKKSGYTDRWIFLPAAGYRYGSTLYVVGSGGLFWSSSLISGGTSYNSYYLDIDSDYCDYGYSERGRGLSIRPVCQSDDFVPVSGISLNRTSLSLNVGENTTLKATVTPSNATFKAVSWISSNPSVATIDTDGKVTAVKSGNATITATTADGGYTATCNVTVTSSSPVAHEYVDLGLSVKWATCNIGASKPEEYGDYFAWGATEPLYQPGYAQEDPQSHWKSGKSGGYNWVNTPYQTANTTDWPSTKWTKYLGSTSSSYKDPSATNANALKTVLDMEDDAAHVNWGGGWRIPTKAELDELQNSCTWTWTTINGINGYKVQSNKSGYTDRWIFLPAAGCRYGTNLSNVGSYGYYWSSSLYSDFPILAYGLYFDSGSCNSYNGSRDLGHSVRPVCP